MGIYSDLAYFGGITPGEVRDMDPYWANELVRRFHKRREEEIELSVELAKFVVEQFMQIQASLRGITLGGSDGG